MPLCYRDSVRGFYCWRNRWQDAGDTVITVLTRGSRGYMGSGAESQLRINRAGALTNWGSGLAGDTSHWWMSPRGETSSLTINKKTMLGVDLSGASGADILLVTNGKAEGATVKLGKQTLTFGFPTAKEPPTPVVEKDEVVVRKQRISIKDGNIHFKVQGK
jgi:hypothetical protein